MALFHLGKLNEAAAAFEETLAGDPEYVIACYQLGIIRERLDDEEGAIACFERVVRANPARRLGALPLGVNYKRKGLDALAMGALAEALKLDPFDTAAAEELQDLQR
jgi:tetratricopeptide (TPR) repeat protein